MQQILRLALVSLPRAVSEFWITRWEFTNRENGSHYGHYDRLTIGSSDSRQKREELLAY
jgi:hypothetical protein